MHDGEQRTKKYVKLIQDIVLRLPNQSARFVGGESNIFNEDVGLHQSSSRVTTRLPRNAGRRI